MFILTGCQSMMDNCYIPNMNNIHLIIHAVARHEYICTHRMKKKKFIPGSAENWKSLKISQTDSFSFTMVIFRIRTVLLSTKEKLDSSQ